MPRRSLLLSAAVVGAVVVAAVAACRNLPTSTGLPPGKSSGSGSGTGGGSDGTSDHSAEPPAPTLRLPAGFTPTGYRATLQVDPALPTFTGTIEITGELAAPSSVIWLNAEQLTIGKVHATVGDQVIVLEAETLAHDFVALRAAADLPAGPIALALEYQGTVRTQDTYGLFVQQSGGAPYVFTNLEPLGARRIFPCVDEPWSKVPWQLSLDVPTGQVAVANTQVSDEQPAGGATRVAFATTRPLPTYLLAFAVGPFERVDAGTTRGGAPIGIITFHGRGKEAAWAAEVTAGIVEILEDWFGTPYPFDKLDSLAIPATVGFGAMENAGLITYRESLVLLDPDDATEDQRRDYVWVAGHEIAHQWFGNLVTPAWWDDLWLNEAFATWMEEKVMATFSPAWSLRVPVVAQRARALDADGLVSARRVRQPIEDADDIENAFDSITYDKGSAVIRMFEAWVGADAFREGVRGYLAAHAGGSATSDDFLAAIDAASEIDVTTAFRGFLDQAGAPRVTAELSCPEKKTKRPPVVTLRQERWLPRGATAPAGDPPRWQMQVCLAYGTVKLRQVTCTVLTGETVEVTLEGKCPQWLLPNADGRGYFRMGLTPEVFDDLLDDGWRQLRPHERVLVAGDVRAEVARGGLPLSAELALVPRLLRDGTRHTVELAVAIAENALAVASDTSRPEVVAWIADTFTRRAQKLGFLSDEGDDLDRELARDALVPLVAEIARDDKLLDRAVELARKWRSLPGSSRGAVLRAAVLRSSKVFDDVLDTLPTATEAALIADLVDALSAVDEPDQARRVLALLLDPRIDLKQADGLLFEMAWTDAVQPVVEEFLRAHVDELIARMPAEQTAYLVEVLTASCDAGKRADAATWAGAHLEELPGGKRVIAQALEAMDQCIARKAAMGPELDAWLAAR